MSPNSKRQIDFSGCSKPNKKCRSVLGDQDYNTVSPRLQRTVETGAIKIPRCRDFAILAEHFPVWLLALHKGMVQSILVVGASSFADWKRALSAEGLDVELVSRCVSAIGGQAKFSFSGTTDFNLTSNRLLLASGSRQFLEEAVRKHLPSKFLLVSDRVYNHCPRTSNQIVWRKACHWKLGGASTFRVIVGHSKGISLPLIPAKLEPTLDLYLNHKLEVTVLPRSFDPSTSAQLFHHPGGLLNVLDYEQPLLLRSPRFQGRWCRRSLSCDEIGSCLGLTLQQQHSELSLKTINSIVPVQILDSCLRTLVYKDENLTCPLKSKLTVAENPLRTSSFLPGLQVDLPHTWIDESTVTAKAAKSDTAAAPSHLWDQRITLVLPRAAKLIPLLRVSLLQWQRRGLLSEFRCFMKKRYGGKWPQVLLQARQSWLRDSEEYTGGDIDGFGSPAGGDLTIQTLLKDAEAGCSVLTSFCNSSWWTWDAGSTLVFWRWHSSCLTVARDGMSPFITGPFPRNMRRRARTPPTDKFPLVLDKIKTVVDRGYIVSYANPSAVQSRVDYFDVPKGPTDVRMVYNGTSCGLNAVTFAPNFYLPTPHAAARNLNYNYCGVDIDLGEMFLNFPLHQSLRPVSGVDLRPFKDHLEKRPASRVGSSVSASRWERCWMGFRPSPYWSVRFYYLAEEFVRGNRLDAENPLRWDFVILNLPGDPDYDPSMPRVFKWNSKINNIAGDIIAFVDDLRATGMDEETAWRVARWVASRLQKLGIQDAPRKRRPPMTETGAWAGAIFSTTKEEISLTVSDEKWQKGRRLISSLHERLEKDPHELLPYKELESTRGFLGHLSMTFENMVPFLKGFHLSLAAHLPKRDENGWKLSDKAWEGYVWSQVENGKMTDEEAQTALNPPLFDDITKPTKIEALPRLRSDIRALKELFTLESTPKVRIRSKKVLAVLYGFCDASGSGFGSMISSKNGIYYRIGLWGKDSEDESSNWREFENAVEACELEAREGRLDGTELFLFTDNSTVEAALYKGNSSSPKLFELVVRLRKLELAHGARIRVAHVAGTRMIAQGTDGVSRGQLKEGVSVGEDILSHIPLNEGALDRSPALKEWIENFSDKEAVFLSPTDWFERGHDQVTPESPTIHLEQGDSWEPVIDSGRTYVWTPPPGAASTAIEELRKARIKRTESTHMFLCPRLLTPEWLKQLHKASDIVLTIPPNCPIWPSSMHEPLIFGLMLPYSKFSPWQLKTAPKVVKLGGQLRQVFNETKGSGGGILWELLQLCKRVPTMSEDVVRRMLHFESRLPLSHPRHRERTRRSSGPGVRKKQNGSFKSLAGGKRKEGGLDALPRSKKRR